MISGTRLKQLIRLIFGRLFITRLLIRSILVSLIFPLSSLANAESLDDAWRLALSGNFKIKGAQQQELAADAQLASANAERLPNLALVADYLKMDKSPRFEGKFGNNIPFAVSYWDKESTYYSASSTLPLYTGGRITADINAAEAQRSAAIANTSHSISSVKMAVGKAYINVLRAQSAVGLTKSHVKSLTSNQTDVENLLNQGLVARNHLLMANVALADAKQQLLQANHHSELAKADYNRLLNRTLDTEFLLEPLTFAELTLPLEELSNQALTRRDDIQTLKHRSEVLNQNANIAKSVSKPQFGLTGMYLHQDNRINVNNDVFAANVSMIWNVFDGGVSRHQSNQLQRQAAAIRAQEDELTGVVKLQVRKAWLALQAAHERESMTSINIKQAEENLSSSKNRYQAGLITNTEVLDAENLRVRAHHHHNDASYDASLTLLQLKHAAGIL